MQEPGGAPVGKVEVSLVPDGETRVGSEERPVSLSAVTNAQGDFRIENVPPGDYRVSTARTGFVPAGRRSQQDSPTLVSVRAGNPVEGLLFPMLPAGVIKGRIVDEDGDALENVTVTASSVNRRTVGSSATTNDLGEYRLSGLLPGKYLVLAQMGGLRGLDIPSASTSGYAPTLFPGTLDRSQAASIEVHPGEEANASFALVVSRTFSIRGQVASLPSGRTPRMVMFYGVGGAQDSQVSARVSPDGSFEAQGVYPGTYKPAFLTAAGDSWSPSLGADTVEVRGADVEGVRLTPQPWGQVRGKFRMDNGQPFNWEQLNLNLDPDDRDYSSVVLNASVQKDGSFRVENVPAGNYHIIVTANSNDLRDYFVKAVNVNGKDAGDSGFAVGPGVTLLDIVAGANGSAIRGTVVDSDDKTVADVQVICIPDESRRKRRDIYQVERTNNQGQFSLRGLNPGDYLVFAIDGETNDITDPDLIQQYEGRAQKLHLDDAEQKTIVVRFTWQ